ncbi:MAG: hypothetical protein H6999_06535 [Hahellaceae bacterium]|nr:hypothetical protein [Hahellaceae bacterium]
MERSHHTFQKIEERRLSSNSSNHQGFDAQTFNIADAFGTKEDIGKLEFRGTWLMSNQNSVVVPSPPTITVGDPVTGIPTQIKLQPIARHFNYHLLPRTREISLALEATGTPDIHALVHRCYRVLLEYGDFYSARLKDAVRA